jgi:photosystem II stability/assembly factor-like uncharacterized protein
VRMRTLLARRMLSWIALVLLAVVAGGCTPSVPDIALGAGGPFADSGAQLTSLAVDPLRSHRLYLGTRRGLFTSTDGGAHWPIATHSVFADHGVRAIAPSSLAGGPLWLVAGDGTIWSSSDGGGGWRPAGGRAAPPSTPASTTPASTTPATPTPSATGLPGTALAVWAGAASLQQAFADIAKSGLYRTDDEGLSWHAVGLPTGAGEPRALVADPTGGHTLVLDATTAIYASADDGLHWSRSDGLSGAPLAIARSASKPNVVYAVTATALYRSDDSGAGFTVISNEHIFTRLAVGSSPDQLYGVEDLNVYRSADGGRGWSLATPAPATIAALTVSPAPSSQSDAIYVGLGAPAGFLASSDGGVTWRQHGG